MLFSKKRKKENPDNKESIILTENRSAVWGKYSNLHVFVDTDGSFDFRNKNHIGPNIMRLASQERSFIVTDPEYCLYRSYSGFLRSKGYDVRCLDLHDPLRSDHYDPLKNIRSEADLCDLVEAIILNTFWCEEPAAQSPLADLASIRKDKDYDPFWEDRERMLLQALLSYICHYGDPETRSLSDIVEMLNGDGSIKEKRSKLDSIFEKTKKRDPQNITFKYYSVFKQMAVSDLSFEGVRASILKRLAALDRPDVRSLLSENNIELERLGDKKTATFVIPSENTNDLLFLQAILYHQTIRYFENGYSGADGHERISRSQYMRVHVFLDAAGPKYAVRFADGCGLGVILPVTRGYMSFSVIVSTMDDLEAVYGKGSGFDNAERIRGECDSRVCYSEKIDYCCIEMRGPDGEFVTIYDKKYRQEDHPLWKAVQDTLIR